MILSALTDYYERMVADPKASMPRPGFSEEKISFAVMVSAEGHFKSIRDLRETQGKKVVPVKKIVPAAVKRSGTSIVPNFLWDNSGYVLGVDGKGKPQRSRMTFDAFKEKHQDIAGHTPCARVKAVAAFLEAWEPEQAEALELKEEFLDQNLIFWLEGDDRPVHEYPDVLELWQTLQDEKEDGSYEAPCLVTGEVGPIARLHPPIKGVSGGQPAGCAIVSFNLDAFASYGKEQSFNAPVGETVAFAYTTALNYLLRRENGRTLSIGDTSTVFWAEKKAPEEDLLASFFDVTNEPDPKDSPKESGEDLQSSAKVRSILRALRDGVALHDALGELDQDVKFFILGLAPNQSRLSVRFWCPSTFGTLVEKAGLHYGALSMERQYPNQPEFPSLWQILLESAVQQKRENIPPLLSGALSRSVLTGCRYPESLYTAILGRIRADKEINYVRAAVIKACLTRNHRQTSGEITMSLDPDRKDAPYLLGRLFSLLEKAQKEALGNVGTSIRNRYFSSASATPSIVFPQLLKLVQHHIAKMDSKSGEKRKGYWLDLKIQSIISHIDMFPTRLSLQEQGIFTIGYYHQSNANYRKNEKE